MENVYKSILLNSNYNFIKHDGELKLLQFTQKKSVKLINLVEERTLFDNAELDNEIN